MCFCKECTLEEEALIYTGNVPPENPIFHLVRAVHMAGRCIDCGLCNEACPADIPLRTLYKRVADILDQQTGYRPGFRPDEKSPFNVIGPAPQ
jgi:ferredoxin